RRSGPRMPCRSCPWRSAASPGESSTEPCLSSDWLKVVTAVNDAICYTPKRTSSRRALARPGRVELDVERADRLVGRHAADRIPPLLDVVLVDDRVLLEDGEAGVFRQRIGEARGQPIVGAPDALAQVEETGERKAAVCGGDHLLLRHVPAGDRLQDSERLIVLVCQEVAEADLVAQPV